MLSVVRLRVIRLSVVRLSVVSLSVVTPSVVRPSVVTPRVVRLSVVRLSVVTPRVVEPAWRSARKFIEHFFALKKKNIFQLLLVQLYSKVLKFYFLPFKSDKLECLSLKSA